MPVLNDIMDHKVLGPAIRQGIQQGILEGELTILRGMMEKRFGELPDWAETRLGSRSADELKELGLRLLDSPSLEELLK